MHLDQIVPLLATNTAAAFAGFIVTVGLYVIAGSLRASIRDKDFTPAEIARFVKSVFWSPEYAVVLGQMAAAALAPDPASRAAVLALLTASVSALTIRLGAQLLTTLKALAGFPSAAYPAPAIVVTSSTAAVPTK